MKILLLTLALLTQTGLPTYGQLADIKDARKVYVTSENEDSRRRVIKALGKDKTLEVVDAPEAAQFFVEFGELSREATTTGTTGSIKERETRNQMRVYTVKPDGRKIIVWSDTLARQTEHMFGMKMYDSGRGESELTKKFLKELKKARGEK
jgi:hypothetical protein